MKQTETSPHPIGPKKKFLKQQITLMPPLTSCDTLETSKKYLNFKNSES